MNTPYHPGEIRMQERAGLRETANAMARTIYPVIAHQFIAFIESQPMVIYGSEDSNGLVWASSIRGTPGFMSVVDEQAMRIKALPNEEDPLMADAGGSRELGLIIIDFATRRRLRINGRADIDEEGITMRPRQVYSNCPRYIQSREYAMAGDDGNAARTIRHGTALNAANQQLIGQADTFFLATFHPQEGADCSHRGGFPGFVQILDEKTIVWPDYNGNSMFNSLGNITEYPKAGLLFMDFENGSTLQLSGSATVLWEDERLTRFPGAERILEFTIQKIIETENATRLHWKFVEYSADNPWWD